MFLPASSMEKSAPHAAKRISLAPGPWQSSMKKPGVDEIYGMGFFSRVGFVGNDALLEIRYNKKRGKVCNLGYDTRKDGDHATRRLQSCLPEHL